MQTPEVALCVIMDLMGLMDLVMDMDAYGWSAEHMDGNAPGPLQGKLIDSRLR